MTNLRARLEIHLGDPCSLLRELGAGGGVREP